MTFRKTLSLYRQIKRLRGKAHMVLPALAPFLVLGILSGPRSVAEAAETESPQRLRTSDQEQAVQKEGSRILRSLSDLFRRAAEMTPTRRSFLAQREESLADIQILQAQVLPRVDFELRHAWLNASPIASQDAEALPAVAGDRLTGQLSSWSLNLRSPVFGFGRVINVFHLSGKQKKLLDLQLQLAERRYLEQVLELYQAYILSENNVRVSQTDVESAQKLAEFLTVEVEGGARPQIDLLQAQAALAQAESQLMEARAQESALRSRLLNILDLPPDTPMEFGQGLDSANDFMELPENSEQEPTAEDLELKLLREQEDISRIEVAYQRSTKWPIISVFAGVSGEVNTAIPATRIPGNTSLSLEGARLKDIVDPDRFNYQAGMSLNWTLVEGLAVPARAEKAQAALIRASTGRALAEKEMKTAQVETREALETSFKQMKAAQASVHAAELMVEQAELDYRRGRISLKDFIEMQEEASLSKRALYVAWSRRLSALSSYRIVRGLPLWGSFSPEAAPSHSSHTGQSKEELNP